MRLTLPYFLRQGNTNRTCAIYYLSVDFCFIVYVDLVSQCPSPFDGFPTSSPFRRGAGRRQKENGNDQHKRTFIEFFLCIRHHV